MKGHYEKVAGVEISSFTFKIEDYYPRKMMIPTGLMVNARATSHIIREVKN